MSRSPRVFVHGLAIAGAATVRALIARGYDVVAADDRPTEATRALAADLGVELIGCPSIEELERLIRSSVVVCPAPGIPEHHDVIRLASEIGVPLRSEIDLAYEWEQERVGGPRPMLSVTGTDGKTTTTLLVVHILETAGLRAVACGNTEVPLVDALDLDVDVFVVEATSFRLAWTPTFRSEAAAWLNLAEDHLDWHASMTTYERAKARLWANMRPSDVAIGSSDDMVVMRNLEQAIGRRVTFGATVGDYRVEAGELMSPSGPLCSVGDLPRQLPHDITNSLCAAALVMESGLAGRDHVARGLTTFTAPAHRIQWVGEHGGVAYYDDSKATTPHAAVTAIKGFDSVVLIAGGRNKGLDLSPLADEAGRIRAVVTIGEASSAIADAFGDACAVVDAGEMSTAVLEAAELAVPGDVVLLSPACASYDQYSGYAERGDDFASRVRELIAQESS